MANSVYQYEQPRCPDGWSESERRFYNRLIEILDDIYSKYGRIDEKMLSGKVTNKINSAPDKALEKLTGIYSEATVDNLYVDVLIAETARITKLVVEKVVADTIEAGSITADTIQATYAHLVSLSAKYGSFDFETVKNLVADAMVLDKGQADYVHITNLAVTYAQAVNATIGNLVILASDGKYYQLDVSDDGKVSATETTVTDGEIAAGETGNGKVIVGTHIVAETLGTETLAATQALINKIDASRINVDTLIAREAFIQALTASEAFVNSLMANVAFINLLKTSKIVGDKSITMIAGDVGDAMVIAGAAQGVANAASSAASNAQNAANAAQSAANAAQTAANNAQASADNLNRLSNIEVIDGTFAQAERREGEGIQVYSEIKPRQDLTWGAPYPSGYGKNLICYPVPESYSLQNFEFDNDTGTIAITKEDGSGKNQLFFYLNVDASTFVGKKITLSYSDYSITNTGDSQRIYLSDQNGTTIASIWPNSDSYNTLTRVVPEGTTRLRILIRIDQNNSLPVGTKLTITGLQVEVSDSFTGFAPPSNIVPICGRSCLKAVRCGRNLFYQDYEYAKNDAGVRITRNEDGTYTLNGTATGDVFFTPYYHLGMNDIFKPGETYSISFGSQYAATPNAVMVVGFEVDGSMSYPVFEDVKESVTFDVPEKFTEALIRIRIYAGAVFNNTVVKILLESGDSLSNYESRQSKVYSLDFGKNLFLNNAISQTINGVTFTVNGDGSVTANGKATAQATLNMTSGQEFEKGTYMLTGMPALGGTSTFRMYYSIDGQGYNMTGMESGKRTFSALKTFQIIIEAGYTANNLTFRPMIRHASVTDATYVPYNPDMLEQTGGMVYGATVDWHAGEMVVDRAMVEFNGTEYFQTISDIYNGTGRTFFALANPGIATPQNVKGDVVCSHYPTMRYNDINNSAGIIGIASYYADTHVALRVQFTTVAAFKEYLAAQHAAGTPVTFTYKLATPIRIPLTPAIIKSINGINTVYTDADDGRVEFGHEIVDVIDSAMSPASPKIGALWLDRSLTPAVLRRWSGAEWEIVNDVSMIESVQDAILLKQAKLEEEQRKTALYLKLDADMKAVRIGQLGVTSEFRIDAFGSGVVVNDEIFSRFEANRVLFGNMEIRKPNVGGLAFDSID